MKHFKGKNLIINTSIAFLPAILITTILLDVGAPKGIANPVPIISLVYLVGIVRKKINKSKSQDHKETERDKKNSGLTKWIIILLIIFVAGGSWFFWFELRPVNIRSYCSQFAAEKATLKKEGQNSAILDRYVKVEQKDILSSEEYKIYYNICLNEHGLRL